MEQIYKLSKESVMYDYEGEIDEIKMEQILVTNSVENILIECMSLIVEGGVLLPITKTEIDRYGDIYNSNCYLVIGVGEHSEGITVANRTFLEVYRVIRLGEEKKKIQYEVPYEEWRVFGKDIMSFLKTLGVELREPEYAGSSELGMGCGAKFSLEEEDSKHFNRFFTTLLKRRREKRYE